jgi:hypothetical protein
MQLPAAIWRSGSVVHGSHTAAVADLGPVRTIHMMASAAN